MIAAAGGVVLAEENREALRHSGALVIWLRGDPALLATRAARGHHRPLLDADPEGNLRRLLTEREPFYREVADEVLDVDGHSVDELVEAITG